MQGQVDRLIGLDANELAEEAGSALAVNMVLLGALLSTGRVPFEVDGFIRIIESRTPSKHLETNLKAFHLGREAATALAQ